MPALDIAFVTDTPTTLAADAAESWVQIAKVGNYVDPRYGRFSITDKDLSTWVANFKALSIGDDRLGSPIDVDHGPEKRGDTEAAGWITDMEIRGKELWAKAEWNDLGVELVGNKRYAYLSPSFTSNFKDETGKEFGTHILGVGLTNRPFLTMATVSLCAADPEFASEVVEPPSDSPDHMHDLKNIALAMGLPEDADEATIVAAVAERGSTDKSLDALAKDEGKVVLSADAVLKMTSDAERGAAAADELSKMKFESAFTLAVEDGRKTPAEKETFEALYDVAPEKTLAALAAAPKVLNTELAGSAGGAGEGAGIDAATLAEAEDFTVDEDRMELHRKTEAIMLEKDIDYSEALALAERA